MKPHIAFKHTLKSGSIALGLALMLLTTLSYGQANYEGPPHNVIYSNGADSSDNDAFPEIATSDYTDVIVNFLTVDTNCQFMNQPAVSQSDMQTLHNAGKTVLVSFGNSSSAAYRACSSQIQNLANGIANFVYANGFNGVDIDFEDTGAFDGSAGYDGVAFLTQLTNDLYGQLSQPPFFGQDIITHAPQTSYWLENYSYSAPPYVLVLAGTGNNIAWFNNQTYSNCPPYDCNAQQKIDDYSAIIVNARIWTGQEFRATRLVLGVPVSYCGTTDGQGNCTGNGYLPWFSQDGNDMNTVISQLQQAYPDQFGGVMGWDFTLDSNQIDQNDTWNREMEGSLLTNQRNWIGYNGPTGLCLDSNDNGNGTGSVYTDSCSGANSQNWKFIVNVILDPVTGLCLDSNDHGNGTGSVYTGSCNGGNYQNWEFFGNTIRDRQTGLCLDSNDNGNGTGSVYTDSCNGGYSQSWFPKY